jgi:predicted amidohydrolase YtcJ
VLTGGTVWTGDDTRPTVQAVAIRDDRIVAVGSDADVLAHAGPRTRRVALDGAFVSPGFIDNHTHFNRAGELLLGVNLLEVSDGEGLRREVQEAAERLPDGAWMTGGMWGAYEQWALSSTGGDAAADAAGTFRPDRTLIDDVSPANPALLWNWDRSQLLANGAALAVAGADCSWAGVECEGGAPTGRVDEAAAARIRGAIPPKTMEQKLAEARAALADLAQYGVTTFFDITPPDQVAVYEALRDRGELTARVNMRMGLDTWDEMRDAGIVEGFGDEWIRYQGLKGFVDGIMGASSARFYDPYLTTGVRGSWRDATNTGYVTDDGSGFMPNGNMRGLVFGADSAGFNPRVHAIGDEAIDAILDIFEEVQRVNGPRDDRRFAIIHNQVITGPETALREAELGIVAEMQPYHTIDDMRWMEERIGERAAGAYRFRSLLESAARLSFGSDWPGTNASWYPIDPLLGIYAAVTRQTLEGEPPAGWYPDERIGVAEAIEAYTLANAWASFEEHSRGSITPGKLADLVWVDRDLLQIPHRELPNARVGLTIVGGEIVYHAE